MADGLVAGLQDRLHLFSIELQEEKFRLLQALIWTVAAIVLGALALAFVSLTIVYLFWESARLAALGGLAGLYVAATIAVVITLRRMLTRQPRPFAATLEELARDRACIHKEP